MGKLKQELISRLEADAFCDEISKEEMDRQTRLFWSAVQDGSYFNDIEDRYLDRLDDRGERHEG